MIQSIESQIQTRLSGWTTKIKLCPLGLSSPCSAYEVDLGHYTEKLWPRRSCTLTSIGEDMWKKRPWVSLFYPPFQWSLMPRYPACLVELSLWEGLRGRQVVSFHSRHTMSFQWKFPLWRRKEQIILHLYKVMSLVGIWGGQWVRRASPVA